ncbi:hypothetical protein I3842_09G113400 [Carya illinoinensis]|uniref:Protein BZR1 homolog n=1 Tax=Carya illinoinensis TaxID=32201 RepID=A0A922E2Y3_CARIL|nr:hypothetical protein I3842_09G113400 [Carya illinoinensis]
MKEATAGKAKAKALMLGGEASGGAQQRTTLGIMKRSVGKPGAVGRTETEKEKTKMRERQRRAITTNIFHGLRKHGGYHLSPRADINEVLRELAKEAGWIVQPDGTTYRSSHGTSCCPLCGSWRTSNNSTTPSSTVMVGSGGEYCSTTASPVRDSTMNNRSNNKIGGEPTILSSLFVSGGVGRSPDADIPLDQLYMYESEFTGVLHHPNLSAGGGGPLGLGPTYNPQPLYAQEARASNQNTPVGSPLRRA